MDRAGNGIVWWGKKKKANDALVPYVESPEMNDKGRRDGEKWWRKKFGLATV